MECGGLYAADRPGRGAALSVEPGGSFVLLALGGGGRVSRSADRSPGPVVELVFAAVAAAGRHGARVPAGLAGRDRFEGRDAGRGYRGEVFAFADPMSAVPPVDPLLAPPEVPDGLPMPRTAGAVQMAPVGRQDAPRELVAPPLGEIPGLAREGSGLACGDSPLAASRQGIWVTRRGEERSGERYGRDESRDRYLLLR